MVSTRERPLASMQECCGLSRRQLIELASASAAVGFATGGISLYVQDLELVTVTDTSFVLTWYTADGPTPATPYEPLAAPAPVAADGMVRYGTNPAQLDQIAMEWGGETPYHYVEVTGLRPGVRYYYQALSGGIAAAPRLLPQLEIPPDGLVVPEEATDAQLAAMLRKLLTPGALKSVSPGSVRTLTPPSGRLLFTLALSNDLHTGETASGLATSDAPAGSGQAPGLPPYPVVMARAMTRDAAARGADVLIVGGDLTAAARPAEMTVAKALLDRFGTHTLSGRLISGDYVVARGNHDQPGQGAADAAWTPAAPSHDDCVRAAYDLPHGTVTTTEVGGLRLIGLDTTMAAAPRGAIGADEFAVLRRVLAGNPCQPTLVFGHHPVTDQSAATTMTGPAFDLDRADAALLQELYAATPGVFFHHSGHTHRNLRTDSPVAPHVEFLEVAATKEYPGGFALLKVYEGGYMVNFYKSSSDLARQWSQVSGGGYLGLYPAYALGTLADRNHVVDRDFSALTPLRHRPWWGQRPRSLRSDAAAC